MEIETHRFPGVSDLCQTARNLSRASRSDRGFLGVHRRVSNRVIVPILALGTGLAFLGFWAGTAAGWLVPFANDMHCLYLGFFGSGCALSATYLILWKAFPQWDLSGFFLTLTFGVVVALNLLGMHAIGDRSIYLLALMLCALLYRGPLWWYPAAGAVCWVLSMVGLALFFPLPRLTVQGFVLATMSVMAAFAGITLELVRSHNALLSRRLKVQNRTLRVLSMRDPLTGLWNRRYFLEWLGRQLEARQKGTEAEGLCLALVDLDNLKHINDTAGHVAGDRALRALAGIFRDNLDLPVTAARIGGDEFVVAFPGMDEDESSRIMERCLDMLGDLPLPGWQGRMGFSCGIAPWTGESDADTLISRADRMLYRAKEAGRNRVLRV